MKKTYSGELEIDLEAGTLYFHTAKGRTLLRIQGLPAPMPSSKEFYDVVVKDSLVSWEPVAFIGEKT
jgi:hypothetical protein